MIEFVKTSVLKHTNRTSCFKTIFILSPIAETSGLERAMEHSEKIIWKRKKKRSVKPWKRCFLEIIRYRAPSKRNNKKYRTGHIIIAIVSFSAMSKASPIRWIIIEAINRSLMRK